MGTWAASNAAAIGAVTSVAGTGLSIMNQRDTAKAQNAAITQAAIANGNQLTRQALEDSQNNTMEMDALAREKRSRIATATAGAASAGVTGLSVDALLADLSGKGLEAQGTTEANYARQGAARADQAQAIQRGAASQLSQVRNVGGADYLRAGLSVANAGVTYARRSKNLEIK
jgi:hypothetical protein